MSLFRFLHHTLSDARAAPDAKLLLLAGIGTMVVVQFPIGWLTGRWVPEYVLIPVLGFLAAGFGIDAYVTGKKIEAEAGVETASITGEQPPAAPGPATATTTTQTTITTE